MGSVSPSRSGNQWHMQLLTTVIITLDSSCAWCAPDAHCSECNLPYFHLLPGSPGQGCLKTWKVNARTTLDCVPLQSALSQCQLGMLLS